MLDKLGMDGKCGSLVGLIRPRFTNRSVGLRILVMFCLSNLVKYVFIDY